MQERHYKTILYFIIAAIMGTLAIQGYWNYKNFEAGKQQLINDVQVSLDNAVNNYYATKTEERFREFTFVEELKSADSIVNRFRNDSLFNGLKKVDSISSTIETDVTIFIDFEGDGNLTPRILKKDTKASADTLYKIFKLKDSISDNFFSSENKNDSLFKHPLAELTSQVMYAMAAKKVDLKAIDVLLMKEFNRKNIYINFSLFFQNSFGEDQRSGYISDTRSYLSTQSSSAFLPKQSFLQINFSNVPETVLKRNIIGILTSLLFVIAITGCLLYLLKVIKNQKQLAEVKNDLISNITHEFKTPLATIGAAMEGIQLFNKDNNIEKTQRYAKVSATQVNKLTIMVEKLLETATLDSENLELNIEETDLVRLLEIATTKEAVSASDKDVSFTTTATSLTYPVDPFHFENALNNLIDNALKYGGDAIEVSITRTKSVIEIIISDNGNELTTTQSKQIFEKFYRVPKGNTHDIKGFGIGLYYTKTIIKKHGGTIDVQVKPTTFKISLS
jgi:signal transduction histidine kinase